MNFFIFYFQKRRNKDEERLFLEFEFNFYKDYIKVKFFVLFFEEDNKVFQFFLDSSEDEEVFRKEQVKFILVIYVNSKKMQKYISVLKL